MAKVRSWWLGEAFRLPVLPLLGGLALVLAGGAGCAVAGPDALARAQARAARADRLLARAAEDSLLRTEQDLPTAVRVGLWARRFQAAAGVRYVFGPAADGYVAERDLVRDHRQDCISLLYRCAELARARSADDAVAVALQTRFAGADPAAVVDAEGRVDYDHPSHLDYSLDMIRSGHWGADVTAAVGVARPDTVGTARYPAGSYAYLPKEALREGALSEGDVVWFVLDPSVPSARRLRDEHGLVIGHVGLVVIDDGQPWLVHAAVSGLTGWYEGGTVVKVPLGEYLARMERFAGVMVTRF
ncbi:MAG: hypothetical protein IPK64_16300 [bacterium]|nr:hypothetical protein [bacterium]